MIFVDVGVDEGGGTTFNYRFASHRTFRYWRLDTKIRRQAREQCRVYTRQNPAQAEVSVDELVGQLCQNVQLIIGQMTRYTANISGTDGFWLKNKKKQEDAVDQLSTFTVFTTYSAADHHWFHLHKLMPSFRDGQ